MLQLPGVMICAASSVSLDKTWEALERSCNGIRFGDAVFFTDQHDNPKFRSAVIRTEVIRPLKSREAYSQFMLKELSSRATCEHILVIQWDGFVWNPDAWNDDFLAYDYIGAPWPHFPPPLNVGNGGFSLRSKRLLDALSDRQFAGQGPEDVSICRKWRPTLEKDFGIRFAPEVIASRFSFERGRPDRSTFGFHGLFNIPDVLPRKQQDRWLAQLSGGDLMSRDAEDMILRLARDGRRLTATSLFIRRGKERRRRSAVGYLFRFLVALIGVKPFS